MARPLRQLVARTRRAGLAAGWVMALLAPFVTHIALVTDRHRMVAAGFAAVQIAMVGVVAARQTGPRLRWAAAAVFTLCLAGMLSRFAAPGWFSHTGLVAAAAVSHAALYLSLLALFGSTLQPGRTPLVTALARRLRGPLSAEILRYTRQVTWLWCGYFAGQIAVSMALLAFAPVAAWSLFVNVLDAPLLVTLFAAEFAVRRLKFRTEHHVSPVAIFRHFSRDLRADAP